MPVKKKVSTVVADIPSEEPPPIIDAKAEGDGDPLSTRWLNINETFYNNFFTASSEKDEWGILLASTPIVFGDENSRSAILLEFLFHNLRHCRLSSFSLFQTRIVMGIVQKIFHCSVVQNPRCSYDESIDMFKIEIRKICTEENRNIFSVDIVKSITTHFSKFFFRNYVLYQTVFQVFQDEQIKERLVAIQSPYVPMPLREGDMRDR